MWRGYCILCLLWIGSLSIPSAVYSQDPTFSQFFAAPLHVNPAFAGITLAPRISLNYRNQWASIDGGYATYAASYEQGFDQINSGIGIMASADDVGRGIYKTVRFSAIYGYRVQVTDQLSAKIGVQAGLIQTKLDWDRLTFPDQIDRLYGFVDVSGSPITSDEVRPELLNPTTFDVSAGLLVYSGKFYGGLAVHHLNGPADALLPIAGTLSPDLPQRYTLHAGAEFDLGWRNKKRERAFISPNVLYARQGDFSELNLGAYLTVGPIFGGLSYRQANNVDALIGLFGYRYQVLRIGYSYDATLSNLSLNTTGGTHEISVSINLDDSEQLKNRRWRDRHQDCFKIFQ